MMMGVQLKGIEDRDLDWSSLTPRACGGLGLGSGVLC